MKNNLTSCSFEGCDKPIRIKNVALCAGHYNQKRLGRSLKPLRRRNPGALCDFEGCDKPHAAKGFCTGHLWQYQEGKEMKPLGHRLRQPGDRRVDNKGYIRIKVAESEVERHDLGSTSGGWVAEHRLVVSRRIGRPLMKHENVHHINGNREDNRPENLELWVTAQPAGQRPEDLVDWAWSIIAKHDPFHQFSANSYKVE